MFKPMPYTPVTMDQLEYVRLTLRAKLKQLEQSTGEKYSIRTFYLGPRPYRARNTNKAQARVAKIGIYKLKVKDYGFRVFETRELDRYI